MGTRASLTPVPRWTALALVLVGCGPTLAQRQAAEREAKLEAQYQAIDDRCFAALGSMATPEAERANCYAWLNQRIQQHSAKLTAQAAQHQADMAAMMAVGAAIRPSAPPPAPAVVPVVVPQGPTTTTCQDIGGGVTNCTSY